MLDLFQPIWLLLLVPLAVACWVWPLPNGILRALRIATVVLVTLAMAQLAIRLPDRSGTVIVVADRSQSMPAQSAMAEREVIDLLSRSMGPRDALGVVAFGREAAVERWPQRGEFGGFTAQVGTEHSDVNTALETALNLIPADGSGRILLVSDGRWTGVDPAQAGARAAGRGIAIDYRLLTRPQTGDLAIEDFRAPDSALPGQGYMLGAWVRTPLDGEIRYQLRRGTTLIAAGSRRVSAGVNRLMFRDRAGDAGVWEYTFMVEGVADDPVPENNQARALVSIAGVRPLLLVSSAGVESGLFKLLRRGGVEVRGQLPDQCRWSLEELATCSGVLIENVSANQIGMAGMEMIGAWVEETGSGLMLTGGQKAYGPGGYFKSPLDRLLPVSMEMRREHRKLALAIVVVLDRSGSMAISAGGGRTKMDLANLGTVQVLDLLSPLDEMGVIAVDSSPHTIVDLDSVEGNKARRGDILSIDSRGGGIFIYEALAAAARMIVKAKAQTRHIILFADANDSEEPGRYVDLLAKCRDSGVTVSVVGLGEEGDMDAWLLKDIAARGGGTAYFTSSPDEIPRLFAQDTFAVARSTFVDEPSPFKTTAGFSAIGNRVAESPPQLGGYNLCYVRPEANLAAVTTDEYEAPVVASWNAGNGRVLCFAGEADGKFSGPLAGWSHVGDFYSTLARWTAGKGQSPIKDELLTQEVRDGTCFIQLHLDPDRKGDSFAALPRVRTLRAVPGAAPVRQLASLEWKDADLLEAAIRLEGREAALNTVEIGGREPVTLPPVCLPYSPEFAPEEPGRGATALAQLALGSGGKERLEIPATWAELPSKPRYVDLGPWLLVLAMGLFLLEVLERRTGAMSRFLRQRGRVVVGNVEVESVDVERAGAGWRRGLWGAKPQKRTGAAPIAISKEPDSRQPAAAGASESAPNLEALRQARERAGRRTGRH